MRPPQTARLLAALLLAAPVLAGCGGTDDPTAEPTSDPAGSVEYDSVVGLRDAAIEAGYECESWVSDGRIKYADESGSCDDEDVFSTYADAESLDLQVQTLEQISEDFGLEPGSSLIGANWTITSDPELIEALQADLGGVVTD